MEHKKSIAHAHSRKQAFQYWYELYSAFLNPCNQKVYTPVSIFKLIWENEKNVILRFKKLMFFPNGLSLEYEIYHFWDRLDVAYPYMI